VVVTKCAGDDERKRQKPLDEFTPRLEMTLVGLEGKLHREVNVVACTDKEQKAGPRRDYSIIRGTLLWAHCT
jgi:hypothetical protein